MWPTLRESARGHFASIVVAILALAVAVILDDPRHSRTRDIPVAASGIALQHLLSNA